MRRAGAGGDIDFLREGGRVLVQGLTGAGVSSERPGRTEHLTVSNLGSNRSWPRLDGDRTTLFR